MPVVGVETLGAQQFGQFVALLAMIRSRKRSGSRSSSEISSWLASRCVRLNTMSKDSSNSFQLSSRSQAAPIEAAMPSSASPALRYSDELWPGAALGFSTRSR